ncbi:hypothetical protein CY35_12G107100 [Sphagnum magellanicum]|jgi:hypothetical protein|nr:hypothetical protein CY35_12G107100 [Sphagnum magellanicum]
MAVSLCTNLGQTWSTHQVRTDGGDISDCVVAMNVGNTHTCRIRRVPADCAAEKSLVNSVATDPRGRRPASQFTTAALSAHGRKTAKPPDVNSRPSRAITKLTVSVPCLYHVTALKHGKEITSLQLPVAAGSN